MPPTIQMMVPDKFQSLLDPGYRYYVYHGGRGSAKSWSIARFLICQALANKLKILCTRELQNSIQESVYTLLTDIIINNNLFQWFRITKNSIESTTGSEFIFKGLAHNIESVKSTEGVDICWIEEADKVSQNSWDILSPTIRKPGSKFIISFNPTFDDDPVYQMFLVKKRPDAKVIEVNWDDNPWFPEVLAKEKDHMKETDYDRYLHVWEGQLRTISDAQVFKGKWVVEEFSSAGIEDLKFGGDFGFANDPMALTRMFIRNQCLYIDREEYAHHVEITQIPAMIHSIMKGMEFTRYPIKFDCSRPETISYLANLHYHAVACKKWQGSVEDGIEYMRGFKKIIIHPNCPNTANEFRRYSYKIDKRTNEILPIVIDDFNHAIDSIRYGLDDLIKKKTTIYDAGFL
jgi:phage terminase large subunit